jgi:hypothetical protein
VVTLSTNGTGADASLTNNVATALAASNVGGNLTVTNTVGNLTVGGVVTANGAIALTTTGNLTIASGAQVTSTQTSGNSVVLSATGNFVNNQGSNAVSVAGSARWLIYSNAPTTDTFNNLNSANTAIWNATYATLPPGSVTLSGNRYVFATIDGTNAATLTFTSTNDSKTYGDVANISSDFTVSGYQTGVANAFLTDTASTAYSGSPNLNSAGTVATATVAGSPYTINIAAGSLTSSSGYAFTFVSSGQLTVNKRPLTATIADQFKTYGTNDPNVSGITVTLNGVVPGDTVSASLASLMRNAGENVASYSITGGTLNPLTGTSASNYTASLSTSGDTLAINQAALIATIANQSKTYGTNDPNVSGIAVGLSGVVNTTVTNWNGTSTLINDTGNVMGNLQSLARTAGENVGSYNVTGGTLTLSGTSAGNYSSSFSVGGSPTLTINQAALTATIGNQSKTYGANDPSLSGITPTLAGVINRTVSTWNGNVIVNDTGLVTASLASLTRIAGENVASYSITGGTLQALSGSSAGNYSASFNVANSPTLTINQAALTATIGNQSKTYGANDPAITPTLSGVVNGTISTWNGNVAINDTGLVTASLASLTRTAGENVGSYAYTAGTLNALNGSSAGNYTASFSLTNNPTLTINQATLTISANNASKTYGQTLTFTGTEFTSNGLQYGETAGSVTLVTTGADMLANAGSYVITASGATGGTFNPANYAINYVNGTLTISPTPSAAVLESLLITANAAGRTSPSTVMNFTILPTVSSLPGNSSTAFAGNAVLPYGNDVGAVGGGTNQQPSNTNTTNQQTSRNQQTSSTSSTNQQTATAGTTNRQTSNTTVRKRRQAPENARNRSPRTVRKPAPERAPSVQGAL